MTNETESLGVDQCQFPDQCQSKFMFFESIRTKKWFKNSKFSISHPTPKFNDFTTKNE
jgi:hypothetical protein